MSEKYPGVEVRGNKIRVYFQYEKRRCREQLNLPVTNENIRYAASLVKIIQSEIEIGLFDYQVRFPASDRFVVTLDQWIERWLRQKKSRVAPSTYVSYKRWASTHISSRWGNTNPEQIKVLDIEDWLAIDKGSMSSKSIKDLVNVLGQIYALYRKDTESNANPVEGIKVPQADREEADAFSLAELTAITTTHPHNSRVSELNMAVFALWTGLRPSEILALSWGDVDLENYEVMIQRSVVRNNYRVTKTRSSKRIIDLIVPAFDALKRQELVSRAMPAIEIDVLQRDNRTSRTEQFRPVFINSLTRKPWGRSKDYDRAFWIDHLINAKVRHRGFGHCRHTFASMMIAKRMDLTWVCEQMGHTSDAMLRKHYVKVFRELRDKSVASVANKKFGFTDEPCE